MHALWSFALSSIFPVFKLTLDSIFRPAKKTVRKWRTLLKPLLFVFLIPAVLGALPPSPEPPLI